MYRKVKVIVSAVGGSMLGGIVGMWVGNYLSEDAFTQQYLLLSIGILLGTLIGFWLAVPRSVPAFSIWRAMGSIACLSLTIVVLAMGVYLGPLQSFLPFQPHSLVVLFWLPYAPFVAPAFATVLVTGFVLPSRALPARGTIEGI